MNGALFGNKRANEKKLLDFGFEKKEGEYVYLCDIAGGQMSLTVRVSADGRIFTEVIDKDAEEEYTLHLVPDAEGSFVGRVRADYDAILEKIASACFDSEVFGSRQAKEIIDYIRRRYGDELEYLWQKFPDNAVVRRRDNRKWYAAVLTVSRRKLGLGADESVEILDLRASPEDIEKTVDNARYFPGYHMNKKHWITVCLDGTVSTEEILTRIDDSYALAKK